jgi:hypothetical protein
MFFEKHINRRSKQAMIEFLSGHFRYYTANSWNHGTSYANRIKIPDLGLTREQADKAYELLDTDYWDELQFVIDDFTSETDGNYTIGVNGRSGGYLALYGGEYYDPGYKSRCRACGQLNYQAVSGEVGRCGRCGKDERINLSRPLRWHHVSAKGMDEDRDFSDWSMSDLRDRVEIVCRFDRACDEIRSAFIDIIDNCKVVEETVMVPKAVKRIVCAEEKQ